MLSILPVLSLSLCGALPFRILFKLSSLKSPVPALCARFFQYLDRTVDQEGVRPTFVRLLIGSPTFHPFVLLVRVLFIEPDEGILPFDLVISPTILEADLIKSLAAYALLTVTT